MNYLIVHDKWLLNQHQKHKNPAYKQHRIFWLFLEFYHINKEKGTLHLWPVACTPDFYVFDADLKAIYHGQLDSSRPGNGIPVTGNDLRNSLDNLLENKPALVSQKPSMGCGIKWK